MRTTAIVLGLFLIGCGEPREWRQGDTCKAADCGDMYCVTTNLKDGTTPPPMCQPECKTGDDCDTHCCLPLLGFDVSTCAVAEACAL